MLFVEGPAAVTPCGDLRANRPCRDGAAKRERRINGGNGLRALADALNGEVAVVHKAAKNALVDIDALNLVEAHLKGPPLDETGLVDDPHVGYVGLGGPAVEPSRRRPVQGRKPSDRRQYQANQRQRVGGDEAPQHQKCDRSDPRRDCRQKVHPVFVGRIQHPFAGL
jgi:hypothetical protein